MDESSSGSIRRGFVEHVGDEMNDLEAEGPYIEAGEPWTAPPTTVKFEEVLLEEGDVTFMEDVLDADCRGQGSATRLRLARACFDLVRCLQKRHLYTGRGKVGHRSCGGTRFEFGRWEKMPPLTCTKSV